LLGSQWAAKKLVDSHGSSSCTSGAGPETTAQGQALVKGESKAHRSNVEHLHDRDGGDASAIPARVSSELLSSAGYVRNRDLARVDVGVKAESDEVADAVDSAAKEVETRAEIGNGGWSKGLDRGENG